MRCPFFWGAGVLIACFVAVAGPLPADGGDPGATDEPRVFDLNVPGSVPEAVDLITLANGDIVVLVEGGQPALVRIDLRNRKHVLQVPNDVRPNYGNTVIAAPDGALLFSDDGRVLRRAPDGRVDTVAGKRLSEVAGGDGGPAIGAGMDPTGLALLPDGSLLIADARNHRIRRVDVAGQISTVAGTGTAGSDGDGGAATQARLTAPQRVSAYPDGSFVIIHGRNHLRVRRVDADGMITTVAGVGAERSSRACQDGPFPARSMRIPVDDFSGGVATQPDGGLLIAAPYLGDDEDEHAGGLVRIADGLVTPILCATSADPTRVDGRDLYIAGRAVRDAFTAFAPSHVTVTPDGGTIADYGDDNTRLRLLTTPGRPQRLGAALAPETLSAIFTGRAMITATEPASARVSVFRDDRQITRAVQPVTTGRTEIRLPHRLARGVYTLKLRVTTTDGRTATHTLRVLGRPFIAIRFAKRLIRGEFGEHGAGEATGTLHLSRCRRQGPRRVRCLATGNFDAPGGFREVHSIELRPDGVLQFRIRSTRGRTLWTYAIPP